jgi:hypothetical protein
MSKPERQEKRKLDRLTASIVKKAKIDMQGYIDTLQDLPSELEIKAWQAGYISGINRMSEENDKLSIRV